MDLRYVSGLPLEEEGERLVSEEIEIPAVDIRTIDQAQDVLLDKISNPKELYYMYRGLSRHSDKEIFETHNLRYDITIIPDLKLGREHNKTVGHYHAKVPGESVSYPEIYEVLHGKAHYLLQKVDFEKEKQEVLDVILVEAHHGNEVIIPPDYGHVTINPGPETLVTANILASNFENIYEPFVKTAGAAYFETANKIIKNKKYSNKLKLRTVKPVSDSDFGINFKKSMYEDCVENPHAYEFLTKPQKYPQEFEKYLKDLKNF